VNIPTPLWHSEILDALLAGRTLARAQVRCAMEAMIAGRYGEVEATAFLIALRMKGEAAAEIAAAAEVLREHMIPFDTGREVVIDTCGTGGDAIDTFNISTTTAMVVAATGLPVVKHGNRAVSSRCGSADVLAALGVNVEGGPAWARRCLDEAGLAFCFAPHFHPALKNVGALRQRLGVRTLFNCLGPLANPARAPYQLLGVGQPELLEPIAGALAELGTRHAFLVSGRDGLGEVSLAAPTRVREVRGHSVTEAEWTAADFELEPCALGDLRAISPAESAAIVQAVLAGERGPAGRVVLANAAAALLAAERVSSLVEGVVRARAAISSGGARQALERLATCSRDFQSCGC
jgi:anthranilate phosphoribosyltransferase